MRGVKGKGGGVVNCLKAAHFDGKHPEALSEGAPDAEGLLRDSLLLGGPQGVDGPHVVQAVRDLDQDHQGLVDHADDHLAEVSVVHERIEARDSGRGDPSVDRAPRQVRAPQLPEAALFPGGRERRSRGTDSLGVVQQGRKGR